MSKLFESYTRALKEANALDFDDLLLKTVELFDKSSSVRERYSRKFRYVMVDDYQDTNRPQYLLVRHLASHHNLCVVGDPDQSIYKWRGADLRNILDFEHDFPEVATVRLERNYRSTQVILDAATAVISNNRNRKEKRLYTDRQGGAKILYYRAGDDLDEAEFVARTSRTALHEDPEHRRRVSDQRAVAHAGGRFGGWHRLQDHRRRQVLRAKRGQGRARLSQVDPEPARR